MKADVSISWSFCGCWCGPQWHYRTTQLVTTELSCLRWWRGVWESHIRCRRSFRLHPWDLETQLADDCTKAEVVSFSETVLTCSLYWLYFTFSGLMLNCVCGGNRHTRTFVGVKRGSASWLTAEPCLHIGWVVAECLSLRLHCTARRPNPVHQRCKDLKLH